MDSRAVAPRAAEAAEADLRVALCGNPNSGKTTLFNALTGLHHKVANYPGVTVERVSGTFQMEHRRIELLDIPGTYSLCAHSPDEAIAAAVLCGRMEGEAAPDVVVVVIDAVRLERGLYLLSQASDLDRPMVVALNMFDLAQRRGIRIDYKALSARLGVAVVPVVARKKEGLNALRRAILRAEGAPAVEAPIAWPNDVQATVTETLSFANGNGFRELHRGEVRRLLFDDQVLKEQKYLRVRGQEFVDQLERHKAEIGRLGGSGLEASLRTTWAGAVAGEVRERPNDPHASLTSKLDRVLLHRVAGPVISMVLLLVVFQALFSWAAPAIDFVDSSVASMADLVRGSMAEGPLQSLLADGLVGGVGAVLVFLPQILLLFFFIGLLEDSGYMPRAAFLADRALSGCGLTGRSLIPLLSSFACAVPGIMATRTIDQRSQRFLTIFVAPLMTCSARLPVYGILIAAFVPATTVVGFLSLQGVTLAALYLLGLVVAGFVAFVLKKTVLKGDTASFVMELPSYRAPNFKNIFLQMYEQGRAFIARAGTVILALTIIIWALSYYPRHAPGEGQQQERSAAGSNVVLVDSASPESNQLMQSYLGRMGRFLEPASMHLGWDWKITVAALASFPAREVIIATLGTLYNLEATEAEESHKLISRLRESRWDHGPLEGRPVFNIPVAFSVMVFFALCCQCMATLATIRRETNSWRWPVFVFSYMTVLALLGAWGVYRLGMVLGLGVS
jgi:ferrous iron transport protein B